VARTHEVEHVLCIPAAGVWLDACISLPDATRALVIFAQGSGNGRFSTRDLAVAESLRAAGIGTLSFELLTREEEGCLSRQAHLRFDTARLGARFAEVTTWVRRQELARSLGIGYFGSCTAAAAALRAAGDGPGSVRAIVCRSGRFDLPPEALARIQAPTLLLAGEEDSPLLLQNQQALDGITALKQLCVLPGSGFLLSEPSVQRQVTQLTLAWFQRHLL
jgi:putative phosphoribosyl transferase